MGIFSDQTKPVRRAFPRPLTIILVIGGFFLVTCAVVVESLRRESLRSARRTACMGNQRVIVLSAMVYANENAQLWPCRPTDAHGNPTMDPAAIDGFCTAAASFELMMRGNSDMPVKVFVCPANTGTGRLITSSAARGMQFDTGVSQWGNNHLPDVAGGPGAMPYTYDWSAPTTTSAIRVMTTDRKHHTVEHKNMLVAAGGDGHCMTIGLTAEDAQRPPGSQVTMDLGGGDQVASFAAKDTSTMNDADDVFDDRGDDGDMKTPGKGSSTRAWVR